MAWTDWLGQLGGWASGNPMEAATLGFGAAGTGLGIAEQVSRANAARQHEFNVRQWLRQNPPGSYYSQIATPDAITAMMRPWMADAATRGLGGAGGAWTQAAADAASKIRADVYPASENLRMQQFQSQFGPYGEYGGQPSPALGALGGVGQSLQQLLLLRALRGQQQPQTQPGAAMMGSFTPEMESYEQRGAPSMMAPGSFYPQSSFGDGGAGGYYGTPDFSGTYGG